MTSPLIYHTPVYQDNLLLENQTAPLNAKGEKGRGRERGRGREVERKGGRREGGEVERKGGKGQRERGREREVKREIHHHNLYNINDTDLSDFVFPL